MGSINLNVANESPKISSPDPAPINNSNLTKLNDQNSNNSDVTKDAQNSKPVTIESEAD